MQKLFKNYIQHKNIIWSILKFLSIKDIYNINKVYNFNYIINEQFWRWWIKGYVCLFPGIFIELLPEESSNNKELQDKLINFLILSYNSS